MKRKFQKCTLEEIVSKIDSGDRIGSSLGNGVPYALLDALYQRRKELSDVDVKVSLLVKPVKLLAGPARKAFEVTSNFMGPIEGRVFHLGSSLNPQLLHLSRIPDDRRVGHPCNVIILQAAPPAKDGTVSFGNCPMDADLVRNADKVLVQFNRNMPYVRYREGMITTDDIDYYCEVDEELATVPSIEPTDIEENIANRIAERIPDGACLQIGIGGLGNAFTRPLSEKKHLGVHTELFVEPFYELMKKGVIDNSRKTFEPGRSLFGFALGSKEMYGYMDHNDAFLASSFGVVNDPYVIAKNDNVVSVNSALESDLTGQICAESFGLRQFSGTGGQVDYVRGATMSKGGQSFIAFPSTYTTKDGTIHSRIKLQLTPGAAVTTLRTDVQYVVTEHGIADLYQETLHNRVKRMIAIADPQFREELTFEAKKNYLL